MPGLPRIGTGAVSPASLACLFAIATPAAEDAPPRVTVDGGPREVLVFADQAVVTRRGEVEMPAGRSVLEWRGLPSALQPGTLRAAVTGIDGVAIRTVRYDLLPVVGAEGLDAEELEEDRARLDLEKRRIDDRRALATTYAELIGKIQFHERRSHDEDRLPLAPAAWKEILDFVEEESSRSLDRLRGLNRRAAEVTARLAEVEHRLDDLRANRVPAVAAALIEVEAEAAGRARIELDYGVDHVAWYPSYSFVVDAADGSIDMVRAAWVGQNTGEDWIDVRLTFSTGQPHRLAVLPRLRTWRIGDGPAGHLEPIGTGDRAPLAADIVRPGDLAANGTLFADNPLAGRADLRLADQFGASGDGSLVGGREALASVETGGGGSFLAIGGGGAGSGAFGNRSGGGKKRALGRYGGSRASESAVDNGLRWLAANQDDRGHWGNGRQRFADTALALQTFLGAGYDHVTPNKYRDHVAAGIAWLRRAIERGQLEGLDLWTDAQVAIALAEAYAMTSISRLRTPSQQAIDRVQRRAFDIPWERNPSFARSSWPKGPHNLAFVAMAMKSAKAAGLATRDDAWLLLMSMTAAFHPHAKTPLDHATVAYVRLMTGFGAEDPLVDKAADRILADLPVLRPGAFDHRFVTLATLTMFQIGGERWKRWNEELRPALVDHQRKDGGFDPIGVDAVHGKRGGEGSAIYATCLNALALEVYYRYTPVAPNREHGGGTGSTIHYVPPSESAGGRDDRFDSLQPEALLSNGAFKLVAFERRTLEARFEHHAVPLAHHGAWLQAIATNEGATALLPGEARLFDGTDYLGSVFLEKVPPDERMVIPLGMDPAVALTRTREVAVREIGFRGQTRRSEYAIRIGVGNGHERPVRVVVRDRVPRPFDARIRVEDVAFDGDPEFDPDSNSGEVRFEVPVAAGGEAGLGIRYALEHPADLVAVEETE